MNKKVYIILLNYNGWKDTIECLESILKNNYDNYQIIVVDNDSPNKSMGYIINWAEGKQEVVYDENSQLKHLSQPHEQKPLNYVFYTKEEALNGGDKEKDSKLNNPIVFIQSGENGGFAAGNNIGIKYALAKDDFEYVWLLNNDTVIEKDSLTTLLLNTNQTTVFGSLIKYYDTFEVNSFGVFYKNYRFKNNIKIPKNSSCELDVWAIHGASMLISKKTFKDIGLIHEKYFLYLEETDYCRKAASKGFKLKVNSSSVIYHKEGKSTNSMNYEKIVMINSNYFYFINRNFKGVEKIISLLWFLLKLTYFTIKTKKLFFSWSVLKRIRNLLR